MLSGKGNRGIVHCRGRGVGLGGLQESLISFGNLIEFFGEWGDSRPMTFTRQIFRDLHEYLIQVSSINHLFSALEKPHSFHVHH